MSKQYAGFSTDTEFGDWGSIVWVTRLESRASAYGTSLGEALGGLEDFPLTRPAVTGLAVVFLAATR